MLACLYEVNQRGMFEVSAINREYKRIMRGKKVLAKQASSNGKMLASLIS